MLARRLTTILPAMSLAEALETTRIHRVAGLTGDRTAWVTTRPFRAPHQTISDVGLIGGGHVPMPGEVSLAHNGVLFLDELPEFRRHALEVLRQPLEEGVIYLQFRGRPESQHFCSVSPTGDVRKEFGRKPVATHHRAGHHTSSVSLPPSALASVDISCFSLDTRPHLEY
jgi:Magnesium chelatase, subunit ChlI